MLRLGPFESDSELPWPGETAKARRARPVHLGERAVKLATRSLEMARTSLSLGLLRSRAVGWPYVVRAVRPLPFDSEAEASLQADTFLATASLQQKLARQSRYWVDVLWMGRVEDGAAMVTRAYDATVGDLLQGDIPLTHTDLWRIANSAVQGLGLLHRTQARAHGQIGPGTILVRNRGSRSLRVGLINLDPAGGIMLTDDMVRLGNLLEQLIRVGPTATRLSPTNTKWWRGFVDKLQAGSLDAIKARAELKRNKPPMNLGQRGLAASMAIVGLSVVASAVMAPSALAARERLLKLGLASEINPDRNPDIYASFSLYLNPYVKGYSKDAVEQLQRALLDASELAKWKCYVPWTSWELRKLGAELEEKPEETQTLEAQAERLRVYSQKLLESTSTGKQLTAVVEFRGAKSSDSAALEKAMAGLGLNTALSDAQNNRFKELEAAYSRVVEEERGKRPDDDAAIATLWNQFIDSGLKISATEAAKNDARSPSAKANEGSVKDIRDNAEAMRSLLKEVAEKPLIAADELTVTDALVSHFTSRFRQNVVSELSLGVAQAGPKWDATAGEHQELIEAQWKLAQEELDKAVQNASNTITWASETPIESEPPPLEDSHVNMSGWIESAKKVDQFAQALKLRDRYYEVVRLSHDQLFAWVDDKALGLTALERWLAAENLSDEELRGLAKIAGQAPALWGRYLQDAEIRQRLSLHASRVKDLEFGRTDAEDEMEANNAIAFLSDTSKLFPANEEPDRWKQIRDQANTRLGEIQDNRDRMDRWNKERDELGLLLANIRDITKEKDPEKLDQAVQALQRLTEVEYLTKGAPGVKRKLDELLNIQRSPEWPFPEVDWEPPTVSDGGQIVTVTMKEGGPSIKFRRINRQSPTFLMTTEMPVGVVDKLVERSKVGRDGFAELQKALTDTSEPYVVTNWTRSSNDPFLPTKLWRLTTQVDNGEDLNWPKVPLPAANSPVINVNFRLASYLSASMGCRLPSVDELRQATGNKEANDSDKNLRDRTWREFATRFEKILQNANDASSEKNSGKWLDLKETLEEPSLSKPYNPWNLAYRPPTGQEGKKTVTRLGGEKEVTNSGAAFPDVTDGAVFVRPARKAAVDSGKFCDLIGNVWELATQDVVKFKDIPLNRAAPAGFVKEIGPLLVQNGKSRIRAVGGSAVASRDMLDENGRFREQVIQNDGAYYPDVGFRLAFDEIPAKKYVTDVEAVLNGLDKELPPVLERN